MPLYHFTVSLVFIFGGLSILFISYHSFLSTYNFIFFIYGNLL
jgi:hypothetical protein